MKHFLQELTDIIRSLAPDDINRQRLILLRRQVQLIIEENNLLRQRVNTLTDQDLCTEDGQFAGSFVEYSGAFFQKTAEGSYVPSVYCPNCQSQTVSPSRYCPYYCTNCGWVASFTRVALDNIMEQLP